MPINVAYSVTIGSLLYEAFDRVSGLITSQTNQG